MILVNKKYFILFFIFVGYLILSLFLVYDENNITYLHSDEQTLHDFALNVSKLDFKLWWVEIQNCYVGLFPNTNLYGTVFWYSLIYKLTNLIGLNSVISLRLVNTVVGFFTTIIIGKYIQKSANVKLSFIEILCISMPFLFFSPTLLRDNYVILFIFSGLIVFREQKKNWILKLILFGVLTFMFRHVSLLYYILIIAIFLYLKYKNKFLIPIIVLSIIILSYMEIPVIRYAMNFRYNFLDRFGDANLNTLLTLPFPINELALLLYSFLGVFPFYAFIILDLPKSLIRIPEMITSLVMFFYILRTYIYGIIFKVNLRYLTAITVLFLLSNIEFSLRRQMVVFPLLLELYYINKNLINKTNTKNSKFIFIFLLFLYASLNLIHLIFI